MHRISKKLEICILIDKMRLFTSSVLIIITFYVILIIITIIYL
jgi:hypothetical protein